MGKKPSQTRQPRLPRDARNQLDSVIVDVYKSFAVPSDKIVADSEVSNQFTDKVNRRLPSADPTDPRTVNSRLLTLRKQGRLPRLARQYNGRNATHSESPLSHP